VPLQLDWIRSFVSVADSGGFGSAAARLFRAQSRVSAHIASLEHDLGAELFDRTQRPVALTTAGHAFYAYAGTVLANVEAGRCAVAATQQSLHGVVPVAAHPSAAATFLPGLIRYLQQTDPGIEIEIVGAATVGLDDALRSGRVAIAIRPRLPANDLAGIRQCPLWLEPMRVVLPARDAERYRGPVFRLADLAAQRLIITGEKLQGETEASAMLGALGVRWTVAHVTDQPEALVALVAEGLGIGFTNALALSTLRLRGVVVKKVAPAVFRQVDLHARDDSALQVKSVIAAIKQAPRPKGTLAPAIGPDLAQAIGPGTWPAAYRMVQSGNRIGQARPGRQRLVAAMRPPGGEPDTGRGRDDTDPGPLRGTMAPPVMRSAR
jgi:DNA-binding transcriptional LysR family regulator